MTDIWLLVVMARTVDLAPFRHAKINTDSIDQVLSQGQEASVSKDAASTGSLWYCKLFHVMLVTPAISAESDNTEDGRHS